LNRKFLKKDAATDVLSFPVGKRGPDGKFYLGDIIISVPQAFKQCFAQPYGLESELKHLTIHGFLHLLGYDHGRGIEGEEGKVLRLVEEE
jgi:probable rRNA maturation factor